LLEVPVRLRLTPHETIFYTLFSTAADNLVDGSRLLLELLHAEPSKRSDVGAKIRDAEHRGDEVTHQILREVNSTFVTPFDREDIYRLASRLDDVMDFIEAASDLVVLYELESMPSEILRLAELLEHAAQITSQAMPRLRSLNNLSDYWIEINRLENDADKLFRRFVARLFSGEYDALMVMKLKEIAEELESAADAFENVADTVETIAVKES
jgi:predicted phosphate transport protein (TIGR00153 family)